MLKITSKMLSLPNINIWNIINYKVLTEIELFKPLTKGGG
jgi:hypothetical protein